MITLFVCLFAGFRFGILVFLFLRNISFWAFYYFFNHRFWNTEEEPERHLFRFTFVTLAAEALSLEDTTMLPPQLLLFMMLLAPIVRGKTFNWIFVWCWILSHFFTRPFLLNLCCTILQLLPTYSHESWNNEPWYVP